MLKTISSRFLTQRHFDILFIGTISISLTNDVLFHLGLIAILIFIAITPNKQKTSIQQWHIFFIMIQYPIFIVLRRAIDVEIDIEFWEDIIRWTIMSSFVIWLPNKQLTPSTKILVIASAAALTVSGIVAYYQVEVLAYFRAGGTENPINFAAFSAIYICIIYAAILHQRAFPQQKKRLLLLITVAIGFIGILKSGSRGPLLALFTAFLLLTLIYDFKSYALLKNKIFKFAAVPGTTFILLLLIAEKAGYIDSIISQYSIYANNGAMSSVGARLELWKSYLDIFFRYPIIGADTDVRSLQLLPGHFLNFNPHVASWAHAHNEILEAAAKRGIVGIISLLLIWLLPLIILYKTKQKEKVTLLLGVILVWFFGGLTQVITHHVSGVTLLPLLISITASMSINPSQLQSLSDVPSKLPTS